MDVDSVSIVAFSDPNDLLSWGLRDSKVRIKDATLIDIWVSNARTWVGAVENAADGARRLCDQSGGRALDRVRVASRPGRGAVSDAEALSSHLTINGLAAELRKSG
jgi:hypothetical protein